MFSPSLSPPPPAFKYISYPVFHTISTPVTVFQIIQVPTPVFHTLRLRQWQFLPSLSIPFLLILTQFWFPPNFPTAKTPFGHSKPSPNSHCPCRWQPPRPLPRPPRPPTLGQSGPTPPTVTALRSGPRLRLAGRACNLNWTLIWIFS